MTKDDLEQAIYERTRRFVPEDVQDAILDLIAAEREACAKVIENDCHDDMTRAEEAAAIRARGKS